MADFKLAGNLQKPMRTLNNLCLQCCFSNSLGHLAKNKSAIHVYTPCAVCTECIITSGIEPSSINTANSPVKIQ